MKKLFSLLSTSITLAAGACMTGDPGINISPKLIGSDFCMIQREKLTWVPQDTRATIRGIRRFNAKWDRRCLNSGPVS